MRVKLVERVQQGLGQREQTVDSEKTGIKGSDLTIMHSDWQNQNSTAFCQSAVASFCKGEATLLLSSVVETQSGLINFEFSVKMLMNRILSHILIEALSLTGAKNSLAFNHPLETASLA
jgi:hypothetical protein